MKIQLNRGSKIPLAQQIYQALADRILSGQFKKGTRLPSVRQFAKSLHVSPVTVIHALDRLESDELITRVHGKGTFVYERAEQEHSDTNRESHPLYRSDYVHRSQDMYYNQKPADINFSLSAVDPALLPTEVLAESLEQLAREQPDILGTYGEIQGDLELRQAMADYLKQENVILSPQEILVTNGSQQGIDLVARCFLGQGDVVFTEEPTYTAAIDVFRSRGAIVIPVPMDDEGMRIDKLTELLDTYTPKLIYTIPTFQNPTGSVMSVRRRRALIELVRDLNCFILEDDPWSEIYFETAPPMHLKSMDTDGNVIYLKGLSKMLSPGCRIGFLIAATNVLNRLIVAKTYADLGNPLLNQKVVLPVIKSKRLRHLLEELRTTLQMRRDLTVNLLKQHAPSGVSWKVPQGGFNIWLSFPERINTNDLLAEAEKQGISFLPSSSCYPGDMAWHHLRISFSNMNEIQLNKGVRVLCSVMCSYLSSVDGLKGSTPLF